MVDIEKIEKRTVRSFYDDGLVEIAVGLILILLSAYFYSQTVLPKGSSINAVLTGLFIIVLVSSNFLGSRFVRFFKRRITYPRTGYVAFKRKEPSPRCRAAAAITAGLIGASMAVLYGLSSSVKTLMPAVNGLLIGIAVFFIANRIGVLRFYLLAVASSIIGVAVAVAGVEELRGFFFYYLFLGAAVLISGLAALIVDLRRTPRPSPDASEDPDAH